MRTPIWFGQARNSAKYEPSASFTYLTLCQCVHITVFPLAHAVLKACMLNRRRGLPSSNPPTAHGGNG